MSPRLPALPALPALLLLLAACAPTPPAPAPAPTPTPTPTASTESRPVRTSVTDLEAFQAYIAGKPTPAALRAQYPGLQVVLPGDLTTREFRGDNSRYFVELDAEGRVVGGRFQ